MGNIISVPIEYWHYDGMANDSSGYDPANPGAFAQSSGPPQQRGSGLRGAARGAVRGAVVGGTVEAIEPSV